MDSDIRIVESETFFTDAVLRTPLKFADAVVRAVSSMKVRVAVENGRGDRGEGWGNILVSDQWAWPSKVVAHEDRDRAMCEFAGRFADSVVGLGPAHPFDIYLEAEEGLRALAADVSADLGLAELLPDLAALVSASPVDAAIHDAFGVANGIDTYSGYSGEFMSHDLGRYLGGDFAGRYPDEFLRPAFEETIPVWHLVGGVDKLTRAELTDDDPRDGLPVSLDQWIERDGVFCLKVKLRGADIDWDVERTSAVADVALEALGERRFHLSTDSNELCESPEAVVEFLRKLKERSPLAYESLLYVEQPTERDLARNRFDMRPVAALKPVLADEGVTDLEKALLARELGWSGLALKVGKSHTHAVMFVCLACALGMETSVQDLTNPGLSFVHSAGFASRISPLMGVEYNSRQYLPASDPEVRAVHEPLFHVVEGQVSTRTITGAGLGYRMQDIRGQR